ncbi:MAG: fumarylacetoacetate hydrolase family protein [Ilumatobacter sp.]|uniref:fumarylacetoacetate hydrolase family protein n=1 Tax=Ilumatobacter sp. TaxID=1967498 RepID=UPI003296CF51
MRLANLAGRASIVVESGHAGSGAVDVHRASDAAFGPTMRAIYDDWAAFREWVSGTDLAGLDSTPFDDADLAAPVPEPRQVFGVGLNYLEHAAESGMGLPDFPLTFTKFPSCIVGPDARVSLPSGSVDWEAELVVVIGSRAHRAEAADAWAHVAGLMVGQDLSERVVQKRPPSAQFSLGKSFPGFGPTGPWLTTPDEVDDPDDLAIGCTLNGETMQASRTGDLIFPVPQLIESLSSIVPLGPGDLIFTGTPSGVGMAREPQHFLSPGDVVVTTIEGLGSITTTMTD